MTMQKAFNHTFKYKYIRNSKNILGGENNG